MQPKTLLCTMAILMGLVGCSTALAGDRDEPRRERARDRIVHVEDKLVLNIPEVPPLCDQLDLVKRRVDIGDCRLYCELEGSGVPLVLVHGGPGATHHIFHPSFSRAKAFARIIYYDQRGCGLSDYKKGAGYSVDQAVDDLEKLRRALKIDHWVVLGASFGGLLAQCYAVKYPDSVSGLVWIVPKKLQRRREARLFEKAGLLKPGCCRFIRTSHMSNIRLHWTSS